MAQTTPGPWRLAWIGGLPIVLDAGGRDIAWVRDGYEEMGKQFLASEIEANARLLTAAPELLRLLHEAVEQGAPVMHICSNTPQSKAACRACSWVEPALRLFASLEAEATI